MGYCLSHFGRTRDAIKAYKCSLKLNPKDRSTHSLLREAETSLSISEGSVLATVSEDAQSADSIGSAKVCAAAARRGEL